MSESPRAMRVRVDCYAGYRGEETPRRLIIGERTLEVTDILDRWLGPDHRYFKIRVGDGDIYILRHDLQGGEWEMVFYQHRKGEIS